MLALRLEVLLLLVNMFWLAAQASGKKDASIGKILN